MCYLLCLIKYILLQNHSAQKNAIFRQVGSKGMQVLYRQSWIHVSLISPAPYKLLIEGSNDFCFYKLYWPLLCSMINSSLLNRLVMGRFYRFLAKELESRINMFKKMYFEARLLISFLGEGSPDPVRQCWPIKKNSRGAP